MRGRNVIDQDFAIVDVVSNGVVSYIDVFGLAIFCGIVRDFEGSLAVREERDRP